MRRARPDALAEREPISLHAGRGARAGARIFGVPAARLPVRVVARAPLARVRDVPLPVLSCVYMHTRVRVCVEGYETRDDLTMRACRNSLALTHTVVRLNACTHARQDICEQRARTHTHTRRGCMRTPVPVAMRFSSTHWKTLYLISSKILASKMDYKQQRRPTDFPGVHVHR